MAPLSMDGPPGHPESGQTERLEPTTRNGATYFYNPIPQNRETGHILALGECFAFSHVVRTVRRAS